MKDENYNDTDGSSSDTKRYYSDPGPMEAVAKENSGANLVYYAQHEIPKEEENRFKEIKGPQTVGEEGKLTGNYLPIRSCMWCYIKARKFSAV